MRKKWVYLTLLPLFLLTACGEPSPSPVAPAPTNEAPGAPLPERLTPENTPVELTKPMAGARPITAAPNVAPDKQDLDKAIQNSQRAQD
jgi:hypothetical protein